MIYFAFHTKNLDFMGKRIIHFNKENVHIYILQIIKTMLYFGTSKLRKCFQIPFFYYNSLFSTNHEYNLMVSFLFSAGPLCSITTIVGLRAELSIFLSMAQHSQCRKIQSIYPYLKSICFYFWITCHFTYPKIGELSTYFSLVVAYLQTC